MKLKNKSKIVELVGAGELKQALDELVLQLKSSKSGSDFLKTATNLSGQLSKLQNDKIDGVITYEQESVGFNKLQTKVLALVESIEKDRPEPPAEPRRKPPKEQTTLPSPPAQSNTWWKWLTVPLLAFGGWWLFLRDPSIESHIRICNVVALGDDFHCNEDMTRLTVSEARQRLFTTADFIGENDGDPWCGGTLYNDLTGAVFPTERIQLSLQEGAISYMAELTPSPGVVWTSGEYRLELTYNGKPAGIKQFSLFFDVSNMPDRLPAFESPQKQQQYDLVPLESINEEKATQLIHPDSLKFN